MIDQSAPEQLTVGDLMTFWVETPSTAFQIGLAAVLDAEPLVDADGSLRLEELRADLERRSSAIPRFRQRVRWNRLGKGRPAWVAAECFDIAVHVDVGRVPPPGDERAWLAWCATNAAMPLDHGEPLWRITFATGRADGAVGMLLVVHHAVFDGMAGVAAFERLFADPPTSGQRLAAVSSAGRPALVSPDELPTHPLRTLRRAAAQLPGAARVTRDVIHQLRARAPDLPWAGPIDDTRHVAVVRRRLDHVHASARDLGSTVNDLVLAAVASALRDLLRAGGDEPSRPLRASMPIAVPGPAVNAGRLVIVELPVTEMTIMDRLQDIAAQTRALKLSGDLTHADVTNAKGFPVFLVHAAIAWASRRAGSRVNLYVTNVVGPSEILRLGCSRLSELVPISPLSAGIHLGVTVFSYAGELIVSFQVDGAIADVDLLAAAVGEALDALALA